MDRVQNNFSSFTTSTPGRDLVLDSFRGLMLVIITLNHMRGPFYNYTFETVGFASAAEGFVFISGIVFGLVYGKKLLRSSFKNIFFQAVKRGFVIYLYHILTLVLIIFILSTSAYFKTHDESLRLELFYSDQGKAIWLYFLLLYLPEQLDILPIYIVFVFMGPLVLYAFYKGKAFIVLLVSFLIWTISQLSYFNHFGTLGNGYFNVLSWQFLFYIGSYIGYSRIYNKRVFPYTRVFLAVAFLIVISLFFIRRPLGTGIDLIDKIQPLVARDILAPVRLLNFILLAYLSDFLSKNVMKFSNKWLAVLGQHSLQVFVFQTILVYYTMPWRQYIYDNYTILSFVMQFVVVSALFIPALLHKYFKMKYPWLSKVGI